MELERTGNIIRKRTKLEITKLKLSKAFDSWSQYLSMFLGVGYSKLYNQICTSVSVSKIISMRKSNIVMLTAYC